MCFFSSPSMAMPAATEPEPVPTEEDVKGREIDAATQATREKAKQQAVLSAGPKATVATSGRGILAPAETKQKTLLGA